MCDGVVVEFLDLLAATSKTRHIIGTLIRGYWELIDLQCIRSNEIYVLTQ